MVLQRTLCLLNQLCLIGSFVAVEQTLQTSQNSPTTSLTRTECCRVRGALAPALFMALTRTKILDPGVSPVMVYLVFSVTSLLDSTQSSAVGKDSPIVVIN